MHGLIQAGERTQLAKGIGRFEAVSSEGDNRTVKSEGSGEKDYSKIPSKYIRLETEFVLETKVRSHWEQGGCRWLTNIIPAMYIAIFRRSLALNEFQ